MSRSAARLGAFVLCLCVCAGIACGSFDAAEAPAGALDGGAPDAVGDSRGLVVDAGDAALEADAAVVVAPKGCAALYDAGLDGAVVVFCDDFEGKTSAQQEWSGKTEASGAVGLSTTQATSGTTSLRVSLAADAGGNDKAAFLNTTAIVTAGLPVSVEFDMFAELVPVFASLPANGFIFAAYKAASGTQFAYAGISGNGEINPYLVSGSAVVNLSTGSWFHYVYRIDSMGSTLDVSPKGKDATVRRTYGGATVTGAQVFSLGVQSSLPGVTSLYFDDVVIHR